MSRIDWAGLMQVGLNGLQLKPWDFWQLTPVELRVMLGQAGGAGPLTRSRLDELVRAFPDQDGDKRNG